MGLLNGPDRTKHMTKALPLLKDARVEFVHDAGGVANASDSRKPLAMKPCLMLDGSAAYKICNSVATCNCTIKLQITYVALR